MARPHGHRLTSNDLVAVLCALAACSGAPAPAPAPPPPPPALDRDLPQLVARSLAMYRDVAGALAATDCAAAATELHALGARHRDVVVANARVIADGRTAELRAALAPHDAELDAAAAAVMQAPAMAACAADPAFAHALDAVFAP